MLSVEGEAGGMRWPSELLSLPFCRRECRSAPERSVHTYVFRRVMALPGMLFVVAVMSLRRSGISDLLGLLALLTIGLEGGRLWLPITLQLALREGIRPSRSSRSPVLVGLRLGCMTGMEGPQKSLCRRCLW